MTYDKQIEGEKLKERTVIESKRCYFEGGFSNSKIDGVSGLFQQGQKLQSQGLSQASNQTFDKDRVSYSRV